MVYFFPTQLEAKGLQAFAKDRAYPQAIIRYATAELCDAGCDLRVCRWNNGYLDRSKPPRLRSFADYRPICEWRKGETVKEVTAREGFPILVPFEVIA
jgi:hypothetical protein